MIHHARCLDQGLEIVDLRGGREQLIAWPEIVLLAIGQVPQEHATHLATGQMAVISSARRSRVVPTEVPLTPGPEALLICEPAARAWRIDHKRMNYEYLGARKTDSATANFRIFVDDLVQRAPAAGLTRSTRAWLDHGAVDSWSFESAADLARDALLQYLLRRENPLT
jgi:hypothetical protein